MLASALVAKLHFRIVSWWLCLMVGILFFPCHWNQFYNHYMSLSSKSWKICIYLIWKMWSDRFRILHICGQNCNLIGSWISMKICLLWQLNWWAHKNFVNGSWCSLIVACPFYIEMPVMLKMCLYGVIPSHSRISDQRTYCTYAECRHSSMHSCLARQFHINDH